MKYGGNYFNYKTVAASQTTAPICGEGGYVANITVLPASSTPGAVSFLDGTTVVAAIVAGAGAGTQPYTVNLGIFAETTKGFVITTGASVSVVVSGNFPGAKGE